MARSRWLVLTTLSCLCLLAVVPVQAQQATVTEALKMSTDLTIEFNDALTGEFLTATRTILKVSNTIFDDVPSTSQTEDALIKIEDTGYVIGSNTKLLDKQLSDYKEKIITLNKQYEEHRLQATLVDEARSDIMNLSETMMLLPQHGEDVDGALQALYKHVPPYTGNLEALDAAVDVYGKVLSRLKKETIPRLFNALDVLYKLLKGEDVSRDALQKATETIEDITFEGLGGEEDVIGGTGCPHCGGDGCSHCMLSDDERNELLNGEEEYVCPHCGGDGCSHCMLSEEERNELLRDE